jgi:hypothetical protein
MVLDVDASAERTRAIERFYSYLFYMRENTEVVPFFYNENMSSGFSMVIRTANTRQLLHLRNVT